MDLQITRSDTLVLKGIAILAMLMHHVFASLTGCSVTIHLLQVIGKVCVALFVLLSGYGLGVGYQRLVSLSRHTTKGTASFLIRRLLKFYVNYWCIFLIFVPLGILCFDRPLNAGYADGSNAILSFVRDVLGIGGFQSYNITWWFNKLILTLYIISPIIFIFTKRLPVVSILAVFLMQRFEILDGTYWLNFWLMPFVLGFVWVQNAGKIQKVLAHVPYGMCMMLSLIFLIMMTLVRLKGTLLSPLEWDTYLALAIALFVLMCKPYWWKSDKILGFLGKHSINIYMIHTFVYYYFWRNEIYSLGNPLLIFLVVLTITLAFSVLIEYVKAKIQINKALDIFMVKSGIVDRNT